MSAIIADVTLIVTAAIGWVGSVAEVVSDTPIILMFCVLSLVGLGVGLFKRLLSVN